MVEYRHNKSYNSYKSYNSNNVVKKMSVGNIDISTDVIATICGGAATECYGVVGMASQKMMDGFYDLLGKDNYSKGIVVEEGQTGSIINLYI